MLQSLFGWVLSSCKPMIGLSIAKVIVKEKINPTGQKMEDANFKTKLSMWKHLDFFFLMLFAGDPIEDGKVLKVVLRVICSF